MDDGYEQLSLFAADDYTANGATPTDNGAPVDISKRLMRSARRLPVHLQQVLIMRFVAGASLEQVADRFGVDRASALAWERAAMASLDEGRAQDAA